MPGFVYRTHSLSTEGNTPLQKTTNRLVELTRNVYAFQLIATDCLQFGIFEPVLYMLYTLEMPMSTHNLPSISADYHIFQREM